MRMRNLPYSRYIQLIQKRTIANFQVTPAPLAYLYYPETEIRTTHLESSKGGFGEFIATSYEIEFRGLL